MSGADFCGLFSWSSSYGLLAEAAALLSKNQNKEKDEIRISSIAAAAIYGNRRVLFPSRKLQPRRYKSHTSSSNITLNVQNINLGQKFDKHNIYKLKHSRKYV